MSKYINVSDESFQSDVLESDIPVLVDFWAPWCGPCVALSPHLNTLAEEYEGQITVAKVNVDDHMEYAQKFGVQGIPRMILFKNGEAIDDITGLPRNPIEKLRDMVKKAL